MKAAARLAVMAALAAASAQAQFQTGPSPTSGSDQGFFRPQGDGASGAQPLQSAQPAMPVPTAPVVVAPTMAVPAPVPGPPAAVVSPVAPAAQANGLGASSQFQPPLAGTSPTLAAGATPTTAPAAAANVTIDTSQQVRAAEEQLDRSQREADRARQLMQAGPAPVNGSFTGLTGERDR